MDVCGNWDLNFAGCCTVLPRCHIERPKNTKRNTVLCFSLLAVLWPLVCQSHDRPALLRTGELENASRCGDPSRRCRCQSHNRPALLQTGELEEACGDPSCCRCCQSHEAKATKTPPAAAAVKATTDQLAYGLGSWKKPKETPPAPAAAVKATTEPFYGLGSWKKPVETPPAARAGITRWPTQNHGGTLE